MSGIEAAGLVLAVFPIVVNGLQHFTEGVETIKSWKRYQRELAKYSRTLETQRIVYLNTIERLFEGVIQSNDELEALMNDPEGAFSNKPQYEEGLRNRLGRSYNNYLLIMADMLEALRKARRELGIDENGKVLWDDYPSPERQVKKLKLVLSKNVYTELLGQIKEANKELKEFTQESRLLECGRSKRRSQRQKVDFKIIRRHARSLYNVMVTGKSWKCKCRKYHMASLRLEPRPWEDDLDNGKAIGSSNLRFRVLLSKEQTEQDLGLSWKWQQIEVQPIETPESPFARTQESQTLNFATLSIVQSATSLVKKKTVSFATPSIDPAPKPTWPSAAIVPSTTGMTPITDICTAIHDLNGLKERLGFLIDESIGQHRHDVYSVDEQIQTNMDAKSLEYLLRLSQQRVLGSGLSRRDRLYIAVTLASSVLQLDGTSWLKRQWRSNDILFLPTEDQRPTTAKMDYLHPYVSWKVFSGDEDTKLVTDAAQVPAMGQIRNEDLFALGIILIELSLKQNLSEMRILEDVQPAEAITNFNTATRLVDDVYNESGSRYGDVVQRCLTCPFNLRNLRDFGLDNEEFQEAVYDHILTPLSQDFEDFNGSQRIR